MIEARQYEYETDLRAMCGLVWKVDRSAVRAGDLQYKLSDPSIDHKKAIRLWMRGVHLVGFAIYHISGGEFIFETKPGPEREEVESTIIQWGVRRLDETAQEQQRSVHFTTRVCDFANGRITRLEDQGFVRDEESCVSLQLPLDAEIPPAVLPKGFTVRRLAGPSEVAKYVTASSNAFLFDNLTEEWRRNVLKQPFYLPKLDLIVVGPRGEFAAICLCWLEQNVLDSHVLVKGYIQTLGTQPQFQGKGIGRGLFLEAVHRMKALGAHAAVGQTEAANKIALHLYLSSGVRRQHEMLQYSRVSNALESGTV